MDRGKKNVVEAGWTSTEVFPDAHVRMVLAKIDGIRHRTQRLDSVFFHPFPARMSLAIAEFIIEQLSQPSATVLDPMVGSGTTLIAAKKLGRSGLGFDLDPLAVKLAQAHTRTLDRGTLQEAHDRVCARAVERLQMQCHVSMQPMWPSEEDKAFLNFWFPRRSQVELNVLAASIQDERNSVVQDFLWSVFSSLIVAKSAGVSYALDLAHSRPHRDLKKQVRSPLEVWPSRFERALKRFAFPRGSEPYGEAEVALGDARRLDVQDATVDLALTSPPYLSVSRDCRQAIDYMRTHKFSLVWMGHRLASLRQLRSTMIGTEVGLPSPNGLPEPFEQSLSQLIPRSAARGRIRQYLSDLHTVLAEIHRVLRPGALAVFVIGPSIMSRRRYDAADIVGDIARSVGLTVIDATVRKLDARRRALPPPRHVRGQNSLNKRMRSEVVMALRKPQ